MKNEKTYQYHELSEDARKHAIECYRDIHEDALNEDMRLFLEKMFDDVNDGSIADYDYLPMYLREHIKNNVIYNMNIDHMDTYRDTCKVSFDADLYGIYLDLLYRKKLSKYLTESTKDRLAYVMGELKYVNSNKGKALHEMLFNEPWESTYDDIMTDLKNALMNIAYDEENYIYSDKYIEETIITNKYEFLEDGTLV
jgi:hypothetical protein